MASRIRKPKHFALESDLCAAFVAALDDDWIAYPETAGWDLLLVRKADGYQIGVQAKLKFNSFVLAQALHEYDAKQPGPDFRAIMVPAGEGNAGLGYLCAYVGVTILQVSPAREVDRLSFPRRRAGVPSFTPGLPGLTASTEYRARDWFECCPTKRCKLPEYVPDVGAGGPAPLQLTHWKIGAIKIAILLERNGFLTRADFSHVGIDHRRWLTGGMGWLKVSNGRYVRNSLLPDFKKMHPINYAQIEADFARWAPSAKAQQGALI